MTSGDDIWVRGRCAAGPWPPGWDVYHVTATGSTNDDLLGAAGRGLVGDHTVLYADHQRAGRGRLDRRWDAPPGANLLVSILFDPAPEPLTIAPRRVALAACAAAESLVPGLRVDLKWPNDLLIEGRKVAGILTQGAGRRAVVGLGFNVGWSPDGAADLGGRVPPVALLTALLGQLDQVERSPDGVRRRHRERLATLGQRVRVQMPTGEDLVGLAEDVDGDGRLIVVDDAGVVHVLDVGDIVHVRPDAV